ncbi:vitelline membrane outer layer protein 1 [Chanos chanos]|uniref:Vitelline membrane outer layer protein 1 n=1 Tax=Chanos chanos TaxID=29144 RepID=A0A6J2WNE6_CHACN|nr:vitelline membrane outer layer protein 1-like [Chanos chanos]
MGLAAIFLLFALFCGSHGSEDTVVKRATGREYYSVLSVDNGRSWGSWANTELCPTGFYATGFSLKVEQFQAQGDDTAVNGIRLYCSRQGRSHWSHIESKSGPWGEWTSVQFCPFGLLKSFQLRVEPHQGDGDDTAVNNIRFQCSVSGRLEGNGMSWGNWGKWSSECPYGGICGIQTRVEAPQGNGDDTALNDVRFLCCV